MGWSYRIGRQNAKKHLEELIIKIRQLWSHWTWVRHCFLIPEIKWGAPMVKSFQDEVQAVFNYASSVHLWIINLQLLPGWQWLTESYQWFQAKDTSLRKGYLHEGSERKQGMANTQSRGTRFPDLQVFGVPSGQWQPLIRMTIPSGSS